MEQENLKDRKTEQEGGREKPRTMREVVGFGAYVVFLLVTVWLVLTYVGQRTNVHGSSMYATLENGDNLWINKWAYNIGSPNRFDIVVFPVEVRDEYYIKRIIGLPGETVRIDEDGTIYINDEPLDEHYGYEPIKENNRGRAAKGVTLGDNEYFVLGDNRNASDDSRFETVGNVDGDILMGKTTFRMWPLSRMGKIE